MKTIIVRGTSRRCGKTLIAQQLQLEFPHISVRDVGDECGITNEKVYTDIFARENILVICVYDDNKDRFPLVIRKDDPFFVVYRCSMFHETLNNHEVDILWSTRPTSINDLSLIKQIKPFVAASDENQK